MAFSSQARWCVPVISVFGKLSREKLLRVERKLDVNVRPCQDEAAYLPSHQLSETQGTMNASFVQALRENEEAAEYAKLLAKRMKEPEEKLQEQISKRRRLPSLRASSSESSQK